MAKKKKTSEETTCAEADSACSPEPTAEDQALLIVHNHMLGAMAAAAVPVPLFDLAAVTAIQFRMLACLAEHYDVPFESQITKSTIGAVIGGVAVPELGRVAGQYAVRNVPASFVRSLPASISKFVPGLGLVAGVLAMPVVTGASTYALGRVFIRHFASGGTFLDFNPQSTRDYFSRMYNQGHTYAKGKGKQFMNAVRGKKEPAEEEAAASPA